MWDLAVIVALNEQAKIEFLRKQGLNKPKDWNEPKQGEQTPEEAEAYCDRLGGI